MSEIFVYGKQKPHKLLGEIKDGISYPWGLALDSANNLYVANQGLPGISYGTVTEYAPGATSPRFTYSEGLDSPDDVAVDSAGTVYVADLLGDKVVEYPPNQNKPKAVIGLPISDDVGGLALDTNDALYVTTASPSGGGDQVYKFKRGSRKGRALNLEGPAGFLVGVIVDRDGGITVTDSQYNVWHYSRGSNKPSVTWNQCCSPVYMAFSGAGDQKLYMGVSNTNPSGYGEVLIFSYPSFGAPAGTPVDSIPHACASGSQTSGCYGVAVTQ